MRTFLFIAAAGLSVATLVVALHSRGEPWMSARVAVKPRSESPQIVARALGKVEAFSGEIGVSSDVTGRIEAILVDEGDLVEKGAELVRLEPLVYKSRVGAAKAAVAQALAREKLMEAGARPEEIEVARSLLEETKAQERLARKNWERTTQLVAAGIVSQRDADAEREEVQALESRVAAAREKLGIALRQTRKEELEAAQAELDLRREELSVAEAELEKTVLRAAISGTVIRKNRRVGEAVSSLQVEPVVTIADLTHLRVRAEVDEIDIGKVHPGQKAELEPLAMEGRICHGTVLRVGSAMGRTLVEPNDPNAKKDVRILEVVIEFDEKPDLPLGLRMTVSFLESPEPAAAPAE